MHRVPGLLEDVPILTLDCNPEFENDDEQTKLLIKKVRWLSFLIIILLNLHTSKISSSLLPYILQVSDFLCRDREVSHELVNHDGVIQQAV